MGQEFIINSLSLEQKINQLLPSQGGEGAGVDLSASTQIIPIVDLTETAEGSSLRADLQSALSHTSITAHAVNNTTTILQNTPGWYRVFGIAQVNENENLAYVEINLYDSSTSKAVFQLKTYGTNGIADNQPMFVDFLVYLDSGDSLRCTASGTYANFNGCSRQIATNAQELVNP